MCGIAFIFDSITSVQESRERMEHALTLMHHRGPDACGLWQNDEVAVGHTRLSIVDLSGSCQPMHSPDNRFVLTFNGEIYNYKELRDSLKTRWHFSTSGDTEVLLAGLVLEGETFVSRLEGMWAFLLWDKEIKKALFSRDRTGKKTIFYTIGHGGFACASELPALKALCRGSWHEDLNSTADYFRYGYPLPGYTFFKNVFELKPASIATWSESGGLTVSNFWRPRIQEFNGSYYQAQERLREVMDVSVRRRLVSDVEVGSFLSGGIDSSIVSALASEMHGSHQLKTFTIGFNEVTYDERAFAREVANFIGVDHHESILKSWDASTLKHLLLERVGQPFQDSSLLPTAEVSSVASQYVKVALSGDGSDELFCGYQRYKARALLNVYCRVPAPIRKLIRSLVAKIHEPDVHHSRSMIKKLHLFMDVMDRREAENSYISPVFFSNQVFEEIFPALVNRGYEFSRPWISDISLSDIKEMMLADTFVYLPQDIHTKVDRASMTHSLETRAPFMDTQVVEFAMSLPLNWVFSWKQNKKILADTFRNKLPQSVWRRRKQGFGVPIASWFRGALGYQLETLIQDSEMEQPFDKSRVLYMLDCHRTQARDFGYRLWLIYVYLVWRSESHLLV